jgi:hypothetical protein
MSERDTLVPSTCLSVKLANLGSKSTVSHLAVNERKVSTSWLDLSPCA